MKKIYAIMVSCLLLAATAQGDGKFKGGLGLVYGTDVEELGIQASFYKAHAEEMLSFLSGFSKSAMVGGDFTYFLAPDPITFFAVNVNLVPVFKESDGMDLYGIAGINWARTSLDLGPFGDASNSSIGLNIGGGAAKEMGFGDVFAEVKLVVGGDNSQAVLGVGVRKEF